jgi:hypothetical protein
VDFKAPASIYRMCEDELCNRSTTWMAGTPGVSEIVIKTYTKSVGNSASSNGLLRLLRNSRKRFIIIHDRRIISAVTVPGMGFVSPWRPDFELSIMMRR